MIPARYLAVMADLGRRMARGPSPHPADGPVTREGIEAILAAWCRKHPELRGDSLDFLLFSFEQARGIEQGRLDAERGQQLRAAWDERRLERRRQAAAATSNAGSVAHRLAAHYGGRR